jgi:hypothetical protein
MATWTNVPNSVLEPGDPIRSVDIIAIKENIIALSEGASGAPKILTTAINDAAVTTEKLAIGERMTTTNVLAKTADASVGNVGTYAWLGQSANSTTQLNLGTTHAGSGLRYMGTWAQGSVGNTTALPDFISTPSGTWRVMGESNYTVSTRAKQCLFLRIS